MSIKLDAHPGIDLRKKNFCIKYRKLIYTAYQYSTKNNLKISRIKSQNKLQ
jgi:hypothetical protein